VIPDRASIDEAAVRLEGRVRRTPVVEVEVAGHDVVLKLELLQHTGSFKPRGAFNRILGDQIPEAGVVAASGGNHGLAVAFAARSLGIPATIFIPEVTPAVKRERIESLGVEVVVAGAVYDDAHAAAQARIEETGAVEIHAYDHPLTVAGQGTVGRELDDQVPDLDAVLVAVGGGGLIAGIASWLEDRVKVVSVEPESIPAMARALEAGRPVDVDVSGIAADSLGARRIGSVPFAVAARFVGRAVLVSDDDIRAAQRWLWDHVRLVAEPGGATALAAVLSGAYRPEPAERVAVVVCGANTDPAAVTSLPGPG
jgi:threonine dehydratase